jgi:DNA-binding beta-propeller fold protein YncE
MTTSSMRTLWAVVGCLAAALLLTWPSDAGANRALLTKTAVYTELCANCPLPIEEMLIPPPEAQIEGPCGVAVSAGGDIYVSDYYHRVVDVFAPGGAYKSQFALGGKNSVFGVNTLDAVCGLAFDAADNLYANEFHQAVLRLKPSVGVIDSGESTGVAVDSAGNVYVNDRTYVAKYAAPVEPGEAPVAKIGLGSLGDAFGLAVFGGKVYVPDAAAGVVKVYEPALKLTDPVQTINRSGGFRSLVDAAVAVDPANGHLLVVDNAQPGFEHPVAAVYEFDSSGGYLGSLPRPEAGGKPTGPIFGEPPGIAVDPARGRLFVTDGNSELSNVYAYGAYTVSGSAGAPAGSGSPAPNSAEQQGSSALVGGAAAGSRLATASVAIRRGPVQVSFDGELTPHALPRRGSAPVGIAVDAVIAGTNGGAPPQLRKLAIAINRNGRFTPAGLPLCGIEAIQPSTTAGALAACGDSLVGEGHFSANVKLPDQSPFPSEGKVLAFNGRLQGKPAILAHVYGTRPAPTSSVLSFRIRPSHGTYGSVLETSLPQATGDWGYVTGLRMTLRRRFSYRGRSRSYLRAGCPAPAGFPGAVFPLARTSFSFAGGMTLTSVLNRECTAKG